MWDFYFTEHDCMSHLLKCVSGCKIHDTEFTFLHVCELRCQIWLIEYIPEKKMVAIFFVFIYIVSKR